MTKIYSTHICKTKDLKCSNCSQIIPIDSEFAVTVTPSRPYEINCLGCTDTRIDSDEKGFSVDPMIGKNAGSERSV